jgi:hypothetical protein
MKSPQKVIGNEEKLDAISRLEKGEQIADIHHNVRLVCSSICMIRDNADWIKESAKCLDNIKCQQSEKQGVFV